MPSLLKIKIVKSLMDRYVSNNKYSLNLSPLFCTYLLAIGIYASAKYISGDAVMSLVKFQHSHAQDFVTF
ncbi:MAG: hypothetical protein ACRD8Z_28195 [Nitrososphaeraceae archaeon]